MVFPFEVCYMNKCAISPLRDADAVEITWKDLFITFLVALIRDRESQAMPMKTRGDPRKMLAGAFSLDHYYSFCRRGTSTVGP